MKLLLDENLSPRLPERLADIFPGVAHVSAYGLGASQDESIWAFAKAQGFCIVSKDSDFAERSVLESPPKVIWLRTGNCSTDEVERILRASREAIETFLAEDQETCLVVQAR